MRGEAQMNGRKLVLIGAGSVSFTPGLLAGLVRSPVGRDAVLGLVDVDAERLATAEKLARKIAAQEDIGLEIAADVDRTAVMEDADCVVASISVGGDEAWEADLDVSSGRGAMQTVGDTVGVGGMSRGFRHAPVLVQIARDMERLCPDATLFNYTNPMMVNCRAVARETSVRCVGLCIGVELLRQDLCRLIGAREEDTWIWAAGINHFVFAYRFLLNGRDAYPLVEAKLAQLSGAEPEEVAELVASYGDACAGPYEPADVRSPFCADLFKNIGFYPGPFDTHVAEFLPQLFTSPDDYEHYGLHLFDIASRKKRAARLRSELTEMADSSEPVDLHALASAAMGEYGQVVRILEAIERDTRDVFFVNMPNDGQIGNLPQDAIVEGPAVATLDGLKPLVFGPIPDPMHSWTSRWLEWCEIVVDAAVGGGRGKALQCLAADPGCVGFSRCHPLLEELFERNGRYMAAFADTTTTT
jgi:alpha-galactosidase